MDGCDRGGAAVRTVRRARPAALCGEGSRSRRRGDRRGRPHTLLPAGANRDPAVYGDSADEFDPGRKNKEHLAFGYGPHRCPGAHLARLEAGVALPALFERLPRMKFAVSPAELGSVPGFIANGHARLPVLLT
ncbi:cytochrome P450 [Nocardia testacea]|uniref:cytochrome P450 n=1 Tax=Nocardia testacea TaxID=248551 RepID=UPI001FE0DAA5|nr:cytochrome P450 [Nocardia testacea]